MKIKEIISELTFHGSKCTKDCSGHLAGHQWANKHKTMGNSRSQSFNNGTAISLRHQDSGKMVLRPSIRGDNGKFSKYPPEEVIKLKKRGLL